MADQKKIVIIGATSSMATACARLWLQQQACDMHLVGRDVARLERTAADLRARNAQAHVTILAADLIETAAIKASVAELVADGVPDIVLIAHGSLPDQAECLADLATSREAIEVNAVSPVLWAEAFAAPMAAADRGTIVIIGSVAGDRGRRSNYVYGAAKGLVTRYAQGMQHRFAGSNVNVVLVKPGPTDTPMTAHLKAAGAKMTPVEDVATCIVGGVQAGKQVIYAPGKWWLIMMIIRHLPRFIFNKMNI